MTIHVRESFVNASEGVRYGDSEVYDTGFQPEELGELYRRLRREYGRCTGRVYVDGADGKPMPVGWVFLSRQQYEDSRPRYDDCGRLRKPDTYLREVWVTVHEKPDTVVRTTHYLTAVAS